MASSPDLFSKFLIFYIKILAFLIFFAIIECSANLNYEVVMFKDFLVSTPDEKGKITTQTRKTQAGKTVYILYEIGRTYNAAKNTMFLTE